MERLTLDDAIKYTKDVTRKNRINKEKNTIIIPNSFISSNDCADKYGQVAKWLEELKSYKDAEEQGLLVRLPCPIGTTVWNIYGMDIRENVVSGIECGKDDKCFLWANEDEWLGEFNVSVFITREEAEKKLEEMKK
jgi:hypothetical protein|nr:MAG TPA: hypothetical protein [Caudoviricetes sp.]